MGDHHHHHHHQVDLLGDFLAATTTTTDTITDTTGALGAVASLSSGYIFLAQTPPPGILKMSNKAHKKKCTQHIPCFRTIRYWPNVTGAVQCFFGSQIRLKHIFDHQGTQSWRGRTHRSLLVLILQIHPASFAQQCHYRCLIASLDCEMQCR